MADNISFVLHGEKPFTEIRSAKLQKLVRKHYHRRETFQNRHSAAGERTARLDKLIKYSFFFHQMWAINLNLSLTAGRRSVSCPQFQLTSSISDELCLSIIEDLLLILNLNLLLIAKQQRSSTHALRRVIWQLKRLKGISPSSHRLSLFRFFLLLSHYSRYCDSVSNLIWICNRWGNGK
jgi:hypothetical protein